MTPEDSRPKGLELKLPPVVVAALAGLMMTGIDRLWPASGFGSTRLTWLAWGLAVLGAAIGLGAVLSFSQAGTTVDPRTPEASARLIRTGLFAYSRNPIYLAMALLLLAYAAKLGQPAAVLFVPAFMAYIQRYQIRPEERSLEALFGAQYQDYCRRVRRWI